MITLPPDLEEAVERHVASGRFTNAEGVLRAALERLDADDVESLKQSLADEEAGRMRPLADVAVDIRQKLGFADSA